MNTIFRSILELELYMLAIIVAIVAVTIGATWLIIAHGGGLWAIAPATVVGALIYARIKLLG